jgi:hypothetical protein
LISSGGACAPPEIYNSINCRHSSQAEVLRLQDVGASWNPALRGIACIEAGFQLAPALRYGLAGMTIFENEANDNT